MESFCKTLSESPWWDLFELLLMSLQVVSLFLIGYYLTLYNRSFHRQDGKYPKEMFLQKVTRRKVRALTWLVFVPQGLLALFYFSDLFGLTGAYFDAPDRQVIYFLLVSVVGLVVLRRSFRKAQEKSNDETGENGRW